MIREVDLVSYLPPFMQKYKEPAAALEAENPEFYLVWEAADRILYNRFISTADTYGISRFEKLLGILPYEEDTIESRRARVQSRWFQALPYTYRVLLEKLKLFCGDRNFTVSKQFEDGYRIEIEASLEFFGQVEELERMLDGMLPCNMSAGLQNKIFCTVSGEHTAAGAVCLTDCYLITNDFREDFHAEGKNLSASGVVITETIEATQEGG